MGGQWGVGGPWAILGGVALKTAALSGVARTTAARPVPSPCCPRQLPLQSPFPTRPAQIWAQASPHQPVGTARSRALPAVQIQEEQAQYHDIVRLDMVDTYNGTS